MIEFEDEHDFMISLDASQILGFKELDQTSTHAKRCLVMMAYSDRTFVAAEPRETLVDRWNLWKRSENA